MKCPLAIVPGLYSPANDIFILHSATEPGLETKLHKELLEDSYIRAHPRVVVVREIKNTEMGVDVLQLSKLDILKRAIVDFKVRPVFEELFKLLF